MFLSYCVSSLTGLDDGSVAVYLQQRLITAYYGEEKIYINIGIFERL